MAEPIFPIVVDRLLRIRSGTESDELPFPLDPDGFLDPDARKAGYSDSLSPGALVRPDIAARVGVLVLLGEPGLGKSTVFESLTGQTDTQQGNIHWIDAANVTDSTFDEELGDLFRNLPSGFSDSSGRQLADGEAESARHTIIIDQLDESPIVRRLPTKLRNLLTGKDASSLRLLVACRTADYPTELTDVLASVFGKCVLGDLAPLTREQVMELVTSAGVDQADFVEAAVAAGAGPLASVPLTLGLLVRSYKQDGKLDESRKILFGKCVLQLLDEHEPHRLSDHSTSSQQRLAMASRLAAYLLLCGRRTLWWGRALDAGPQDLHADLLAAGAEKTVTGSFQVTPSGIMATLSTALFTGRGHSRLAFRHSSIAAYLAASYIAQHELPTRQLQNLFLVAGGKGAQSIPELLRETAAWLVNIDPAHAEWLVKADPQSLVGHSRVVDSNAVRALIVESLLRRADEVELSHVFWARARWQLDHPGIGEQLNRVLVAAGDIEPTDWPALSRVRLAVRLAREAGTSELTEPLLNLAENDNWSAHMRQLAALTAFETKPQLAAPRLVDVLSRLRDATYAKDKDPDDELRGSLLDMLWPEYMQTSDVLPHLTRQRNHELFGSYRVFKSRFPEKVADEEIHSVLEWAVNELQATDIEEDVESTSETQVEDTLPEDRPIGRLDTNLIESLVNRGAAASVDDPGIGDEIAKLVWPRLRRYDQPPIPSPFSLVDTEGHEPPPLGQARRGFAVALVRLALHLGDFNRGTAWQLLDNWRAAESWRISSEPGEGMRNGGRNRLLDSDDFQWALKEADRARADGEQTLGKALGTIAALLFDPMNRDAVRTIYYAQANPAWEELRWWFQPVDLQGETAEQMKRAHGFSRSRERDIWAESDAFVDRLNQHFQEVIAGDLNAFWQLVWKLQYDPSTGRGRHPFHDDLLSFPGVKALPDDARDVLSEASFQYVAKEHDRANEWLGTNRYDKRGWAGYLALALIEQSGQLDEVPEEAWSQWTGAILWFHAVSANAGDRERKTKLLAFAAQHAPEQLARSLETYVRGELARGQLVAEVELVTPAWHTSINNAWKTLLEELAAALQNLEVEDQPDPSDSEQNENDESLAIVPDTIELPQTTEAQAHGFHLWELMLASLAHSDYNAAVDLATRVVRSFQESDNHRQLAIHSGRVMLRLAARDFWPLVEPLVNHDASFGHEFALSVASKFDPPDLNELEPVQLEEIYRWLAGGFPPEEDREYPGAHFVSPEEQAREFRDHILRLLSERATEDAIEVLVRLQTEFPERLSITSTLIRARSNFFASAWVPPTPGELSDLLKDSSRRFVRSPEELSDLTIEILREIGTELPAHGELLWDRIPKRFFETDSAEVQDAWIPKPEAALSAYVANELRHRLQVRGVAVNREVLVLPRNPYGAGDRTDILVECTVREHPFEGPVADEMRLVVEVKCAWNKDVLTDQKEQLAQRYLPEASTEFGIYLVGWHPPDQWTDQDDYRLKRIRNLTIEGLLESLRDQAIAIASELNIRVTPIVIAIPRPHPQVASADSV